MARDLLVLLAQEVARHGDAEGRRESGASVPRSELVVRALTAPKESGEPAGLAQCGQPVVAAGEDLPRIALVPDVPDDLVARRVEAIGERNGELDHAEPGA